MAAPAPASRESCQSAPRFHASDPGGDQTVGDDADEGDGQSSDDPLAGICLGKRLEYLLAQIAGANHRADDDHAECEEDRLVYAEHDLGESDRQLDVPEELASGASRYDPGLDQIMRHLPDTVIGVADRRHDGEGNRGDECGDIA